MSQLLKCSVLGVGAYGQGFTNWQALAAQLVSSSPVLDDAFVPPKPALIPANERRRAPLPVKMAVEVSSQAAEMSGVDAKAAACVFGSGLGDTEITDYMCRALTTEEKLLSPTKFHNSVHNAAAGYWTISAGCQKAANSVAAYFETASLSLLEAMTHCHYHQEPVLVTLFDTKAHSAYRDVFTCDQHFAASIMLCPEDSLHAENPLASLTLQGLGVADSLQSEVECSPLRRLWQSNPAARILPLLEVLALIEAGKSSGQPLVMHASPDTALQLTLEQ